MQESFSPYMCWMIFFFWEKWQYAWLHLLKYSFWKELVRGFSFGFHVFIFCRLMRSFIVPKKSRQTKNEPAILFAIDLHIGLTQFARVCLYVQTTHCSCLPFSISNAQRAHGNGTKRASVPMLKISDLDIQTLLILCVSVKSRKQYVYIFMKSTTSTHVFSTVLTL